MNLLEGTREVPVIYTAHHASHDFGEFEERVALTTEQKLRFSDYGTSLTVPLNGLVVIVADRSRGLGDLNRDPDDPGRFQYQDYGQPVKHDIWKPGQELTEQDKLYCQSNFYTPFHNEIIDRLKVRNDLTFVVAWDNTAHYVIGEDSKGNPQTMRPFVLSNRGLENSSQASVEESTSCDPKFLEMLAQNFSPALQEKGLPTEVLLNFVFKGGYICRRYSTLRNKEDLGKLGVVCDVQSLQLEYDTTITHDQETLEPKTENIDALREAFSKAICKTIKEYSKINIHAY